MLLTLLTFMCGLRTSLPGGPSSGFLTGRLKEASRPRDRRDNNGGRVDKLRL